VEVVTLTPVVAVLTGDLFFRVKIEAVAKAAGVPVRFAGSVEEARGAATVLVDLADGVQAIEAVGALKAGTEAPVVVAFGPHREGEAFRQARAAGADRVLARSAFVERLPELLRTAG
jgi:tryptophan synthase alpha subunit